MTIIIDIAQTPLLIAGVDEAGRGPLAGPVAVAAVILDPAAPKIRGIADSKVLTAARREELEPRIRERAIAFCVVLIDVETIDRINIFQATMHGMAQALRGLGHIPHEALIDGNHLPKNLPCPGRAIIDGDAKEKSIGAASILAKVARDRYMDELDARHPGYGFCRHKGYSTPEHLEALRRLGPCLEHRRSFAPVKAFFMDDLFAAPAPTVPA